MVAASMDYTSGFGKSIFEGTPRRWSFLGRHASGSVFMQLARGARERGVEMRDPA